MSATFCVFHAECPAKASVPLLGRLVADPRRPLSNYRPAIDLPPQPDQKSPIVDITMQKSTTMSTEAIKKASVIAGLGTIVDGDGSTANNIKYSITADEVKTYSMQQVSDAWKAVKDGNEMEMTNFVKENKGKAYFMVSIKTAVKPSIDRGKKGQTSGGLKSRIPLAALTSGTIPALLDPQVGFDVSQGENTTSQAAFDDEIAFAAEYRVVALVSDFKMSLKKLVSRRQFLEDKGLYRQPARAGLAFSGDDDDSGIEDDDDDIEKFI
jgi:hypothetical protein